jgi:NAD(P)-dependent dehydrogenase (short-subunit alcohol dehydrogenase family)
MMAYEFKEFNVRVNTIAPGYFPSINKGEGAADSSRPLEAHAELVPIGEKDGTESEIAQGVLFLAKNRFVTGEVLNIDNGEFLRNPLH